MSDAFLAPDTLDDAVAALAGPHAPVVVAGGTDLLVDVRLGRSRVPGRWLSLHRVSGLEAVRHDDTGVWLGAGTTHAVLERDAIVRSRVAAVADAAAAVGGPATRALGTLGGNVVRASPAMDLGAPLLVHGARVRLRSDAGERDVALETFLLGPGRTGLRPGELMVGVTLTAPGPSAYVRLAARGAMEVPLVAAAARLALDGDRIADAAVALCAVAPTCVRSPHAEAVLIGARADAVAFEGAGVAAAEDAAPIGDHRAPHDYRTAMIAVVVARALAAARASA